MLWSSEPSFRFEIDNFSEKEDALTSQIFVSNGCEWYLKVYPKGEYSSLHDHMALYLIASDPNPSQTGWKRRARYYFSVLNQSDRKLYVSSIASEKIAFSAKSRSWGFGKTLPLSKLSKFKENGLLENDRLIIEVYIKFAEVDDGEKKETLDINGFQAFASQVNSVMRKTFTEHVVNKDYKNALSNACNKVSELAEEGFKMDWLKSKIDEVYSKMNKSDDADRSQVQQLEERIKNLEVMGLDLKMDCSTLKSNLEDVSQKSDVQQLKERIKNLELMERRKVNDADGSQVQQLEERIKNLGARLDNLESELEDASSESEESDDDYESRIEEIEERLEDFVTMQEIEDSLENLETTQKIEDRLKNLETMVSNLKDELDA